jgi:hypothetical protein
MEEWKYVEGYPEYEVSSLGRLRSHKNGKETYFNLKPDSWGYVIVTISKDGERKGIRFHRLVAQHFLPNPENLATVNHLDGNKLNNAVSNLEWASQSENNKHSFRIGLKSHKGEKGPAAKISNKQAKMIRDLYKIGEYKQKDLAEAFHLTQSRISAIVLNQAY